MDFSIGISTIIQGGLTLLVGALVWLVKRSISDFDESIKALNDRIDAVDDKNGTKIEKLQEQFHNFQKDMPLVYTTREDFVMTMNRVEDKLNRILYSRSGGNNSE